MWPASICILICPSCPDGCSPLVYSKVQTVLFNTAADSNYISRIFKFRVENDNSMLLRNVGNHLPDSTVSSQKTTARIFTTVCASNFAIYAFFYFRSKGDYL